ncbi:hypothetical protein SAMN05880582_102186 [Rhizobium sp. RU20A]|uniref:hypothetical protein n=1 Tax=Rhizobium sp. RU20A TaxID=1907412 RepID=UPI00095409E5|nr:hypothetical protein [Rhizobium sp. RU20A]SIQ57694.1 hypothetical protein SAMN05880582_102186 [Rhizobium sp. RU20A]
MCADLAEAVNEPIAIDPVDEVLSYHAGDIRAAILTLLKDCVHLREQLALMEASMSRGMTRGWRPAFERP